MTAVKTFIEQWRGNRVDYDKVFDYQCVDEIKQYLDECFGLKPGAWGNAVDYWTGTHPAILEKFDKVQGTPQLGDIIVYGQPYGRGVENGRVVYYGHIAIATSATTMLEQNGGSGNGDGLNSNAIRERSILTGRLGLLRPKGGIDEMRAITRDEVYWNYFTIAGYLPSEQEITNYVGKDYDFAVEDIKRYFANRGLAYYQYRTATDKQLKALTDLVNGLGSRPTAEELQKLRDTADKATQEATDAKKALEAVKEQQKTDQSLGEAFLRFLGNFFKKG